MTGTLIVSEGARRSAVLSRHCVRITTGNTDSVLQRTNTRHRKREVATRFSSGTFLPL